MKTISENLIKIIAEHANIHNNYSGRGMLGEVCFGFSTDNPEAIIGLIQLNLINQLDLQQEFAQMLQNLRRDTLGFSYILYFPKYQNNYLKEEE